ncbi:hypothetical protein [Paraburkholderia sp. J41]|uniref:hypothetical protein n=1 Tax=Paraburkholderia sp. J41 TaxID=2805433 RepID=UPI002AC33793|nr:hypothetical protein [Paraburkholderia sp. J41]
MRRISIGGALVRVAGGGFMHAAQRLAEGRFDGFESAAQNAKLDAFFQGKA